jgi:hypothetical protein
MKIKDFVKRITIELGFYRGEDSCFVELELFRKLCDGLGIIIFRIQIYKFIFSINFD